MYSPLSGGRGQLIETCFRESFFPPFHGDNTGSNPVGDAIEAITYKRFQAAIKKRGCCGD